MPTKGIVSAGHQQTAEAAIAILKEGGNAFDAVVAALFAACVTEPVLCSLGGGGFLLARTARGRSGVLDFFVQTPLQKRAASELDFYPIIADFGSSQQEFHIGQGAIATPGMIKGLFAIQKTLGSMPMRELVGPAVDLARNGVPLNALQSYIFSVVAPICLASPESRCLFESATHRDCTLREGERYRNPETADLLEVLAIEGEELFYKGEVARRIAADVETRGGYLTRRDFEAYRTIERQPLSVTYRDARILTNPVPSSGGILIALALKLLEEVPENDWPDNEADRFSLLAEVMRQTSKARLDAHLDDATAHLDSERMLDPVFLRQYRDVVRGRARALRGTTHISVMDAEGNIATATVSNGEGCGSIVPNTGIMLNNMLGEEDLNPHGFHHWQPNQRMTSMMSPSIVQLGDGRSVAMGSGGSNRIRTALLQVMLKLVDQGMDIESAVHAPRIHLEGGRLNLEGGFAASTVEQLQADWSDHVIWNDLNLFFGGVHSVLHEQGGGFSGCGDPRRGGVCLTT
jgi:gamma-glutamyltranspeptidase / glutathione hydrolase